MLTIADWLVVCVPIVLGLMGAYISIKPPQSLFHWYWFAGFLLLGMLCAGATLWQLQDTRQEAQRDKNESKNERDALNHRISGLQTQVSQLQGLPKSVGDIQATLKKPEPIKNTFSADVGLHFISPKSVLLMMVNLSKQEVVRDPKYMVALWDLDTPRKEGEMWQPLPIPAQTAKDFIRPREYLGPTMMMDQPGVRSIVNDGDRIFGWAQVLCSNCRTTRWYWLYLVNGAGGWYAEGKPPNMKKIGDTLPLIAKDPQPYLLEVAPLKNRVVINDPDKQSYGNR